MEVKFKRLFLGAKTPKYAHAGDACFDIPVLIDDDQCRPLKWMGDAFSCTRPQHRTHFQQFIQPDESVVFHTGLAFEVPEGHVMLIFSRSSTGIKDDLVLTNGTGVIDSGYRGEVHIALRNTGFIQTCVTNGQRVAQAMIVPYPVVKLVETETFAPSERGTNGIGSSGRY